MKANEEVKATGALKSTEVKATGEVKATEELRVNDEGYTCVTGGAVGWLDVLQNVLVVAL